MKLLFVTQKIDEHDDDLAFVAQWVDQFIQQGISVEVLCLEKGFFDDRFPVYSLGKELGYGKFRRILRFYKYIFSRKSDFVFVHMNPEYFTFGGWYWYVKRMPMFLWYTHYTTHVHLKLAAFYCKNMFAATKQSLPQYSNSTKKIVTRHGIDTRYWSQKNTATTKTNIVMVHRLSRSKRVELGLLALNFLPTDYNITIYGRPIDEVYYQELLDLVEENSLSDRVFFKGPVPMPDLRSAYPQHRIMINMASETIDKTMLEAMCNGVFPVTTSANMEAIGLDYQLKEDSSEAIAKFILEEDLLDQDELLGIVEKKHSLSELIKKIVSYF